MWLEFDFGDLDFEFSLLRYLQRLLGQRYSRLAKAAIERDCGLMVSGGI